MVKHLKMLGCAVCFTLVAVAWNQAASGGQISGELKKWHKVTLTFDGPETSETANPNPFLYYRLNVTFKHQGSSKSYLVPGYYATDGDAANTSADGGNKWRVHFAPDAVGTWRYNVSFRKGLNVAVSERKNAGQSAGFMDGQSGSFDIGPTDKTGRDFRGKGLLRYVGKHHLRFAETGEYFLKCGADAPENFLAYADFDGDFKTDGHKDELIKTWAPHIKDWKPGDPTWQNGKGKGIIGAVNYLASKGMNVFSFLTLNIKGDDQNVFPYISYTDFERLDCSRLDQWEIIFEHADKLGMYLHFKTLETENELLLDKGDLGVERKLYYRELIARFSHHLALNWNLGEEINNASTEQKVAWADYLWTHDPYQHHIVNHNGDNHYDLLGSASKLTGFSLQTNKSDFSRVHSQTRNYIDRSVAAGKPWVVACDEPGDATHALITDAEDPTRDNARKNGLWGNIMAGGAGVEWYFGYKHPHSDLTCQDWRSRDNMWDQCRYALEFFRKHKIPFWDMKCEDEMTENTNDYVLCKPGQIYLVYLKHGGKVQLTAAAGNFTYGWFNPRTGDGPEGLLKTGSVNTGRKIEVTAPDKNDWLLVIKGSGKLELASRQAPLPEVVTTAEGAIVLKAVRDFRIVAGDGFVPAPPCFLAKARTGVAQVQVPAPVVTSPPFLSSTEDKGAQVQVPAYKDGRHNALAINPDDYKDKFAAAQTKFTGKTGTPVPAFSVPAPVVTSPQVAQVQVRAAQVRAYDITLTTMVEIDGESTYKLLIDGKPVGQFTNPKTSQDYKPTLKTWKNISVDTYTPVFAFVRKHGVEGAIIRVEFNTATNSKAKQGRRMAYARGRWLALTLTPPGAAKASEGAKKDGAQVRDTSAFDSDETTIFEESGGLVAVEAEHFAVQTETDVRKWYVTSVAQKPQVSPDGD